MGNEYTLAWHGEPVGTFQTGEGLSVENFEYVDGFPTDVIPTNEDGVPNFLHNLRPQGMMNKIFNESVHYKFRAPVSRFLSNFTVRNGDERRAEIDYHDDMLEDTGPGPYRDFVYFGETPCATGEFIDKIKRFWSQNGMPRYSGFETKLPVTLKGNGLNIAGEGNSFTHFLKLPPTDEEHRRGLCFNEWYCLELSRAAGLPTSENAMVFLDEEPFPSLLSERFDIPDNSNPTTWLISQDACSLGDEDFSEAGNGSYEKLFKTIEGFSTDPDMDREDFYRRMVLTLAVQDTDFHKKNISMLIEYDPQQKEVVSRRIAPTYDVTSDIYSNDNSRGLTLSIAGKKSNINRKAMVRFGESIGLDKERAEELLDRTMTDIVERAIELSSDRSLIPNEDCGHIARRITTLAVQTAKKMGVETPQWQDEPINKAVANGGGRIGFERAGVVMEYL